ncbi:MAG: hypothetical protein M1814_000818 [Vezdaea aestivalis]|nr:MAG: hypothetical protein M1814_000818 [Vezdaea aestivalis]
MARYLFEKFTGADLTDLMLNDASKLFNENYGVWGKRPAESRAKSPRPGKNVAKHPMTYDPQRSAETAFGKNFSLNQHYAPTSV